MNTPQAMPAILGRSSAGEDLELLQRVRRRIVQSGQVLQGRVDGSIQAKLVLRDPAARDGGCAYDPPPRPLWTSAYPRPEVARSRSRAPKSGRPIVSRRFSRSD